MSVCGLFEAGLHEVFMHSQCVIYSRRWSTCTWVGEAVAAGNNKTYFSYLKTSILSVPYIKQALLCCETGLNRLYQSVLSSETPDVILHRRTQELAAGSSLPQAAYLVCDFGVLTVSLDVNYIRVKGRS